MADAAVRNPLYGGGRFPEDRLAVPSRTKVSISTMVASGVDFGGCDNGNPDICSCATWGPVVCETCGYEVNDGDLVRILSRVTEYDGYPNDFEWDHETRHVTCPTGARRG